MDAHDLKLSGPCPVDLDAAGVDRSGLAFHCGHCDRQVHVLSNMTRRAAAAFVAANRARGICVSYARTPDGTVRYADDEPYSPPVSAPDPGLISLDRVRSRSRARVAAASALLALAACTPHGDEPTVRVEDSVEIRADVTAPVIPARPETPPVIVEDGELEPIVDMVEGELAEEPCDTPPAVEPTPTPAVTVAEPKKTHKKRPVRGRLRRFPPAKKPEPKKQELELVDGFL